MQIKSVMFALISAGVDYHNNIVYCRITSKMPVRCTEDQDLVGEEDE